MTPFDYHRPETLAEAVRIAGEIPRARYVAGGTDMMVRIRAGRERPDALISLGRIDALARIELGSVTRIGARATIGQILAHDGLTAAYPLLALAARPFASVQVRNLATVGGNLCNASPAADMAPVLLALDARVEIEGPQGTREVPLDTFFKGPGQTALAPLEVLTAVVLERPRPNQGSCFLRRSRVGMDIALTSVAVHFQLAGDRLTRPRVAAGAVAPCPLRLGSVEGLLEGRTVETALLDEAARLAADEIAPITDIRASASYRRRLTSTLVRRAIAAAWEENR